MVVPRGHPQIVVRNDTDFPHGAAKLPHGRTRILRRRMQIFRASGCGSSAQIRVENGRNQKANFVRNNRLKDRETRRKDRSNYHYRKRSGHEIEITQYRKMKEAKEI